MKPYLRILIVVFSLLPFLISVQAQRDDSKFDFYARGPYRENVPRPQSFLRYDVGQFHTNYSQMERVIEAIAKAASDRVRIADIGLTNEHRMQHLVIISSPENMTRIDEIKANVAKLTDPRRTTNQEAQNISANTPIIVWLAYTIHGNESASFEAMMQVVYQLAASNEQATLDMLKNCVVVVNVCENPDGHERFVTWYNSVSTGNPDRAAQEHREPWTVYGRVNHYRFDLNRDNIATSQVETRNQQKAFMEWNPQIFVDHHGQPSQFFFPPAALPINPNLPSKQTERWLTEFGRANAAKFDANNWDYYIRDIFDLFYPGYWDSWPSLNGATGMTYETDGGGFKGINWTRDDGTIATLRSAVAKHFTASLTTLETASRNRQERLKDFYEFRRTAIEEVSRERMKRVVIVPGKDPVKTAGLIDILQRANIEIKRASANFNSASSHSYQNDTGAVSKTFPAGSYVIDLSQPQKRLIKALLESDTPQDAAFVKDQLDKFARNQQRGPSESFEDYGFYDITAWSLPLAFGVEAYWTEDVTSFAASNDTQHAEQYGLVDGRAKIAYIIPYETDSASALAYQIQKAGYRIAVSTKQLNTDNRTWSRGTLVVRVSRNPDSLHEAIEKLSKELKVKVYATNTGFNEKGDNSIGGENVISLTKPRIVVLADEGVDTTSYGALWWTLEQHGIDFTPMTFNAIRSGGLEKYNVLIMPDGSAGRYFGTLGKPGVDGLKDWIRRGGTLICIKGASVFAALKDVNLSSVKLVGSDDDDQTGGDGKESESSPSPTPQSSPASKDKRGAADQQAIPTDSVKSDKMDAAPPVLPPIASPSAKPGRVPEGVPGAIMRSTVNRTTYLTFGIEETTLPVLLNSGYFFRLSKEGTNAIVFVNENNKPFRVSGFVWPNNTEKLLRNTAYVVGESEGGGKVILFAEDPTYRAIFRSTNKVLFNAILFPNSL